MPVVPAPETSERTDIIDVCTYMWGGSDQIYRGSTGGLLLSNWLKNTLFCSKEILYLASKQSLLIYESIRTSLFPRLISISTNF